MIVRTTNDPAAWRDLGPWQPDAYAPDNGEVTTAYLDADDLARLRARDAARPAPKTPRRVTGVLSRAEIDQARQRGAQRTAERWASRRRYCSHLSDKTIRRALTNASGEIKGAGIALGVPYATLWRRVNEMRRSG